MEIRERCRTSFARQMNGDFLIRIFISRRFNYGERRSSRLAADAPFKRGGERLCALESGTGEEKPDIV